MSDREIRFLPLDQLPRLSSKQVARLSVLPGPCFIVEQIQSFALEQLVDLPPEIRRIWDMKRTPGYELSLSEIADEYLVKIGDEDLSHSSSTRKWSNSTAGDTSNTREKGDD